MFFWLNVYQLMSDSKTSAIKMTVSDDLGQMSFGQMSVSQIAVHQIFVSKMFVGKLTVDQMSSENV
jgi:hypothetical protein